MRRHGIAAPERKRNSVASASVSITKTTSTDPACSTRFDQTDSSARPSSVVSQPKNDVVATVRMVAMMRIVPKASPTRKSRVFSRA